MKIGFLGAGRMAQALASGFIRTEMTAPENLICSSRSRESGAAFLKLFHNKPRWTADNAEVFRASDVIVLAIKPQQMPAVLPGMRESSAGKLVLSLAAGVTLGQLGGWLHPGARLVRAMPNTPMQIGRGASVYAAGDGITEADLALVDRIFNSVGKAWRVDEAQIDAITALSGSGPAYVFHFIDAMIRGGLALGLDEELTRALALQTVLGSAELAAGSTLPPMELAAQVKSPRGTTVAGCAVLEENEALVALLTRCMAAAKARAEELSRGEG